MQHFQSLLFSQVHTFFVNSTGESSDHRETEYKKLLFGLLGVLCAIFLFISQSLSYTKGMPLSFYGGPISFVLIEANFVCDSKVLYFLITSMKRMANDWWAHLDAFLASWSTRVQPVSELNVPNQNGFPMSQVISSPAEGSAADLPACQSALPCSVCSL